MTGDSYTVVKFEYTAPHRMSDLHLNRALAVNLRTLRKWAEKLHDLTQHMKFDFRVIDDDLETEWSTARSAFNAACTRRKALVTEKLSRKYHEQKNQQRLSVGSENSYKPFHRERRED